jgi:hypothetical protein
MRFDGNFRACGRTGSLTGSGGSSITETGAIFVLILPFIVEETFVLGVLIGGTE